MIKKLKKKFILLATVSTFLLMTVLVGSMNLINYTSVVRETDTILEVLSGPHGPFDFGPADAGMPDAVFGGGEPTGDGIRESKIKDGVFRDVDPNYDDSLYDDGQGSGKNGGTPDRRWKDGGRFMPKGMSPEVPYESRFFTAVVTADGEVRESDFSRIVTVSSETVESYVKKAMAASKDRGFIGQFRFLRQPEENTTRIMFLDCGRRLDSFRTFMWTSMAVGLLGCVIVFVIFLFAAGRIVRPIAESYEKQKRFITDAGHEIKTPLTIISANLDLLEADLGEHESFADIRTQTKRLSALTGDLVYLSKMEEAEDSLKKIEFPVSDLLAETAGSFRAIAQAGIKNFEIDIEENITMNGAPDAVCQLASILLDNAMKYSPEGGTVLFKTSARRKELVMTVSNTALSSVEGENLSRMFDRFYRADASRNSETGGHGIGLSIARAIVNAHGGKISASAGEGGEFVVTAVLPL